MTNEVSSQLVIAGLQAQIADLALRIAVLEAQLSVAYRTASNGEVAAVPTGSDYAQQP